MTFISIALYIVMFMYLKGRIITIVLVLFDDDGPASAIVVGIDRAREISKCGSESNCFSDKDCC